MPKIAQRQYLTKIAGVDGLWATFSGGEANVDHTKIYDGGAITPDVISGNSQLSDITTSRPFDPTRDGPIRAQLVRALAQQRAVTTTITRTPTDPDYTPNGDPEVYEVVLKTVTPTESDANGSDPARLQLVWTTRSAR